MTVHRLYYSGELKKIVVIQMTVSVVLAGKYILLLTQIAAGYYSPK